MTGNLAATTPSAARGRRTITVLALLALLALGATACSASTSASPQPSAAIEPSPPAIDGLQAVAAGSDAVLIASLADADGDLLSASVDWGDGQIDQILEFSAGLRADHTYAAAGSYAVVVTATDGGGRTASEIVAIEVAPDDTTTPETTGPTETTEPPETTETTIPPTTAPPTTTPPTTAPPTTAPPTTAPPTTLPPIPEAVTVDLLPTVSSNGSGSAADGAGGSGEYTRSNATTFRYRSFAWHGYNGYGEASGSLRAEVALAPLFDELPDRVSSIRVEIDYAVQAQGEIKAPWDRTASTTLRASSWTDFGTVDEQLLISESKESDDDDPIDWIDYDGGGTLTMIIDREAVVDGAVASFSLAGFCSSSSGGQAFALLNEGYCDFFEKGFVQLTRLSATVTPVE